MTQGVFWLILLMILGKMNAIPRESKEFQLMFFINKLKLIDWKDGIQVNEHLRQEELELLADYQVSPFREMVDLRIENNVESSFQEPIALNQLLGPFPTECGRLLHKAFSLLLKSSLISEDLSLEEAIQIVKFVSFFSIKQPKESGDFRLQRAVIKGILAMKQQGIQIQHSLLDFLMFELTLLNENLPFHPRKMQIDRNFPFPDLILQLYSLLPEPLKEITIRNIHLHRQEHLKILAMLIKKSSNHLKRLELSGTFLKENAIDLNFGSLKVLESLNLENNFLQNEVDDPLQVCLWQCEKTLKSLNLAGNYMQIENLPLSLYLSNLQELELSGNYFFYPADEEILKIIKSSPMLKILGFNSLNSWKPVRLAILFEQIAALGPNLQVLKMKRCILRDRMFSFQFALKSLKNLQHLELEGHPVHSLLHAPSSLQKLSIDSFTLSTFDMQFLRKAKESLEHLEVRCNHFEFGLNLMFDELFRQDKIDSLVICDGGVSNLSHSIDDFYAILQKSKRISHLEIPSNLLPIHQCKSSNNPIHDSTSNSLPINHSSCNLLPINHSSSNLLSIQSIVISFKNESHLELLSQQTWIFPNCKQMKLIFYKLPPTAQLIPMIQQVKANTSRPFRLILQAKTSEFFSKFFQPGETDDFEIAILVEEIVEISLWEAIKLTVSRFLPKA